MSLTAKSPPKLPCLAFYPSRVLNTAVWQPLQSVDYTEKWSLPKHDVCSSRASFSAQKLAPLMGWRPETGEAGARLAAVRVGEIFQR